nr:kinesin-like protein KIF15 [Tanacetum cinerariifolium]
NFINILADVYQTGKKRNIPYRDSKLTYLLQESLSGVGMQNLPLFVPFLPYKVDPLPNRTHSFFHLSSVPNLYRYELWLNQVVLRMFGIIKGYELHCISVLQKRMSAFQKSKFNTCRNGVLSESGSLEVVNDGVTIAKAIELYRSNAYLRASISAGNCIHFGRGNELLILMGQV